MQFEEVSTIYFYSDEGDKKDICGSIVENTNPRFFTIYVDGEEIKTCYSKEEAIEFVKNEFSTI